MGTEELHSRPSTIISSTDVWLMTNHHGTSTCSPHSRFTITFTTPSDTAYELKGGVDGGAGTAAGFGVGGGGFIALGHAARPFGFGFGGGGGGGGTLALLLRRGKEIAPDEELGVSPPSLSEPGCSEHRRDGP